MFLKAYSQISDKKLIEQLNGNIYYQFFCGIVIPPGEGLTNYKIVSQIRCEIAKKIKIKELQKDLSQYWELYVKRKEKIVIDATCYESQLRYPTNAKLLWESLVWLHKVIKSMCKRMVADRLEPST